MTFLGGVAVPELDSEWCGSNVSLLLLAGILTSLVVLCCCCSPPSFPIRIRLLILCGDTSDGTGNDRGVGVLKLATVVPICHWSYEQQSKLHMRHENYPQTSWNFKAMFGTSSGVQINSSFVIWPNVCSFLSCIGWFIAKKCNTGLN